MEGPVKTFGETKYGHTRAVAESREERECGVTLLGDYFAEAAGLVQREEHGDTVGAASEIKTGSDLVLIFERQILFSYTGNCLAFLVADANWEEKKFGVYADDFIVVRDVLGYCNLWGKGETETD